MLNKITLLALAISLSCINSANANLSLSDLSIPKSPAYRVGISEIPENQYIESVQNKQEILKQTIEKQARVTKINNNDVSYAELSIKRLSQDISNELEYDEQDMVSDLSLLWQGAATQSDTINFALYKLANPDADKPNKSAIKNLLKNIASMSTLVGAGLGNPLLAGTSLIGGNVLGIMSQDTKALNYKYSKVSDADMIILIRKVEDLQQNTVNLYYDYMSAKRQLELTTKLVEERRNRFELAQRNNTSKEIVVVTDTFYRTSLDKQRAARCAFLAQRAALEQFVGNEAFTQFEQELVSRENSKMNEDLGVNSDYDKTVKQIEDYTNNLENKTVSLPSADVIENDKNLSQADSLPEDLQVDTETELIASNPETSTKEKKVKKDSHDLKGLIFIHDQKPVLSNYAQEPQIQAEEEQTAIKKSKRTKRNKKEEDEKNMQNIQSLQSSSQTQTKVQPEVRQGQQVQSAVLQQPSKKYNGVELLPLDVIRVPDLKPHGYSIFSE